MTVGAAREGDRDPGGQPQPLGARSGQAQDREGVVLDLFDHETAVAEVLQQRGSVTHRPEVQRRLRGAQARIHLAQRKQRLQAHRTPSLRGPRYSNRPSRLRGGGSGALREAATPRRTPRRRYGTRHPGLPAADRVDVARPFDVRLQYQRGPGVGVLVIGVGGLLAVDRAVRSLGQRAWVSLAASLTYLLVVAALVLLASRFGLLSSWMVLLERAWLPG